MDGRQEAQADAADRPQTPAAAFERQAALAPARIALIAADRRYDYAELDARANALALRLQALGLAREQLVAVWMERCAALPIALLAVAKAGAAYLPLYVGAAPEQQRQMLAESGARLLLHERGVPPPAFAQDLQCIAVDADEPLPMAHAAPQREDDPAQLAYVMYTSGSSGQPKGICTTAGNIAAFARDRHWRDAADARVLLHSSPAFDASTYELWTPLINGATVVMAPPGALDAAGLRRAIAEHGVTDLWLTAGLFHALAADAASSLRGLRQVIAGGDAVAAAAVRRVQAACPELRVLNGYGPTETTTFATLCELPVLRSDEDEVPIGLPLDGAYLRVLDDAQREVAAGVAGELWIGGAGVARGYLQRPELTAQRFVPDPYGAPGDRLYRSGDRVWRRADGALCFLGRADRQIKLRGFRVEPGEIETRLARLPRVAQAAVRAIDERAGHKRLVAYVARADAGEHDADWLRATAAALAAQLPDYMHPAAWVMLPRLPLTANGKIDLAALPAPAPSAGESDAHSAWRPQEQVLAGVFADVLGLDPATIGADDDFIALGGDSLSAVRVAALAAREGLAVSARQVLAHRSVARLSAAADRDDGDTPIHSEIPSALRVPALPIRAGTQPALFCFHPGSGLSWPYRRLARHLGGDYAIYGLQARSLREAGYLPASVEAMASDYVREIRALQPDGPYRLLGWCLGGATASAAAALLEAQGERVSLLCVVDFFPGQFEAESQPALVPELETEDDAGSADEAHDGAVRAPPRVIAEIDEGYYDISPILFDPETGANTFAIADRYRPAPLNCDLLLVRAAPPRGPAPHSPQYWAPYVRGALRVHDLPCEHALMLNLRYAEQLARLVQAQLDRRERMVMA
ncbi:amino acid adenylation domain-containing protein [Lysobacter sp. 5GHs7-4]|uniref:amino acid adenylation domain-containing protein n=1 Tax=Lysobacter sp. 5GHs7-4 TaxID=2904253 RepID=UPI001E32B86B|nr:amino acid adenylation domain-containing protein [Lysobacter sp. 5GHs7-4]UHQ23561.1 amino acid adenylation domain-containing protein [Lysobacter sp. 5GHs7-4]